MKSVVVWLLDRALSLVVGWRLAMEELDLLDRVLPEERPRILVISSMAPPESDRAEMIYFCTHCGAEKACCFADTFCVQCGRAVPDTIPLAGVEERRAC